MDDIKRTPEKKTEASRVLPFQLKEMHFFLLKMPDPGWINKYTETAKTNN